MNKIVVITLLTAVIVAAYAISARAQTRSYYDRNGSFAGSAVTRGNTSSYSDPRGHFSGTTVRNSNGTTSAYDRNGHFVGSVVPGKDK